ncbi:MAG: hypothetical protein FJ095_10125 [Deltaproteobacteria bacterium]|nr:hypothetical protein [Deltaproteobacteria bacterium]
MVPARRSGLSRPAPRVRQASTHAEGRSRPCALAVLGQQRFVRTLSSAVAALDVRGRFALVTAGWQEREGEDQELADYLGGNTVNLRLHRRADELFAEDRELAEAHRKKQELLRYRQDFYRIRLEHELAANHVIRLRQAPREVLAREEGASIVAIQQLDEYHLRQCAEIHEEFDAAMKPLERATLRKHADAVAELIDGSKAIAIAGGHVATLVNRMRLFDLAGMIDGQAVFAWSGGAMAISERIVLFHDNTPEGAVAPEVLDYGLGLLKGVVVLPQPEQRLHLDDRERVQVMARRFAPAKVLAFPQSSHLTLHGDAIHSAENVSSLDANGDCRPYTEVAS